MIVPQFWAEAKHRERINGRSVTLRRYGWSDSSEADAMRHAEERLKEAFEKYRAGETYRHRDRKVAYNGADGVPIREEILARHGETIITRNSYGAKCLNTPDVLFVDVDLPGRSEVWTCLSALLYLLCAIAIIRGYFAANANLAIGGLAVLGATIVVGFVVDRWETYRVHTRAPKLIRERIARFLDARPTWRMRLYESPNGFRLLAMHRRFDPTEPEVAEVFRELGADPTYVRMCLNQRCFRARVSPKPWRVGIDRHLSPRPGVWPVNPARLADRAAWVTRYEEACREYASCRFLEDMGTGTVDSHVADVQRLHDELSHAQRDFPLA